MAFVVVSSVAVVVSGFGVVFGVAVEAGVVDLGVTEPDGGDWVGIVVPVNPGGGVELGVTGGNKRRVVLCVSWVAVLGVVKRGVVPGGGGGVA